MSAHIPFPTLIAIVESEGPGSPFSHLVQVEAVCAQAAPRTVALQLRNKTHSARERLELGAELRRVCSRYEQSLLINDRLDLAVLLRADGVHLGSDCVSPADARALLGADCFISVAWHSGETLPPEGADAALFSPVFAARKGRRPCGSRGLTAAVQTPGAPAVYALGGVSADNAAQCLDCGAAGVAAIGALWSGSGPAELLGALGIRR